jgi:hypothetical protein
MSNKDFKSNKDAKGPVPKIPGQKKMTPKHQQAIEDAAAFSTEKYEGLEDYETGKKSKKKIVDEDKKSVADLDNWVPATPRDA